MILTRILTVAEGVECQVDEFLKLGIAAVVVNVDEAAKWMNWKINQTKLKEANMQTTENVIDRLLAIAGQSKGWLKFIGVLLII